MSSRLEKLRDIIQEAGVDAAVILPGSNLFYLTGSEHHLMERPFMLFVPQDGQPVVVIPSLEAKQFKKYFTEAKIFTWTDADGYAGAFEQAFQELDLENKRVGVEGIRFRFFDGEVVQQHEPSVNLVNLDDYLQYYRIHKDADEITKLRKAIQMSEAGLTETLKQVKVGMTELEITNILTMNLTEAGSEGMSFPPIVLGGANSALPHGHAGSYQIKAGDALLFDFGVKFGGYPADITRTFFVAEEPDEHCRAIYEAVLKANQAGIAAGKQGVIAETVDAVARQELVEAGFEEFVVHRTGHGLGLDGHEHPNIAKGNKQVLEPGMVFTIEPGLYEEGVIGVRIEDNVVITQDGAESLSTFPRELTVIEG